MTNVLVIMTDDMRTDFLQFMPNVQERMIKPGRFFPNARAHTPVCAPSRLGFMMSQYAQTNTTDQGTGTATFDLDDSLMKWVQEEGYRTAMIGKFMNQFPDAMPAPLGFDWWRQMPDAVAYSLLNFGVVNNLGDLNIVEGIEQQDYIRDSFFDFVAAGDGEPWFAYLAPTDPHTPFNAIRGNPTLFSDLDWPLVLETDVSDKPSWIQASAQLTAEQQVFTKWVARMQAVELFRLDKAIGEMLDQIDLDETVVILTSDNGLTYGEHRVWGNGTTKNDLYESSCLVPLVMVGQGISPGVNTENCMVGQDVSRTILALTGATSNLAQTDGLNLMDLVVDQAPSGDWVNRYTACWRGQSFLGNNPKKGWSIISSDNWKLMVWEKINPGDADVAASDKYELYNLGADPDELVNRAYLGGADLTKRNTLEAALTAWKLNPT